MIKIGFGTLVATFILLKLSGIAFTSASWWWVIGIPLVAVLAPVAAFVVLVIGVICLGIVFAGLTKLLDSIS